MKNLGDLADLADMCPTMSNSVYTGTNNEGLTTDPFCDASKKLHISGSLVVAPKPRLKKIANRYAGLQLEC